MQKQNLYRWMEDPDMLDDSTLDEISTAVEEYPFFHTAKLLYTKNLHLINHPDYEETLTKTAILCNDRKKLFYLIYREEYNNFLNQAEITQTKKGDRTEELLESFLSSLGENEISEPSFDNIEMNLATTDYFTYLQSLGDENNNTESAENQKLNHHDIIDAFIEKAETEVLFVPKETSPAPAIQTSEKNEEGNEFLTETLAKIYIKQKKYEQALTIIKRLSLNFPKKSVYFAHQIRFLELLIINEKNKDK